MTDCSTDGDVLAASTHAGNARKALAPRRPPLRKPWA
jgi:hypothetical protein